jgi:hypothetical protein
MPPVAEILTRDMARNSFRILIFPLTGHRSRFTISYVSGSVVGGCKVPSVCFRCGLKGSRTITFLCEKLRKEFPSSAYPLGFSPGEAEIWAVESRLPVPALSRPLAGPGARGPRPSRTGKIAIRTVAVLKRTALEGNTVLSPSAVCFARFDGDRGKRGVYVD